MEKKGGEKMAGELDQQAIEVSFKATKISYNLLVALSKSIVESKDKIEHGEQSLKKLNMQGRKLESIDLPDSDIKSFRKQLNKHSVDFSIMQNKDTKEYTIFFKGQDIERVSMGLKNCLNDISKNKNKKSFKETAKLAVEKANSLNKAIDMTKDRTMEKNIDRGSR